MWRIFGGRRESRTPGVPRAVAPCGFSVVDVETTGLCPSHHDRIIELAVIRLALDGTPVDEFSSLINPGRDIGPTRIHGITTSDVLNAPRFLDIAGDIADRLAENAIVAHNARFDIEFLGAEFGLISNTVPMLPAVCTMHLARLFGDAARSYRLEALCEQYGIPHRSPHSALEDARATARLFTALLQRARAQGVTGLQALGCEDLPGPAETWPPLKRGGKTLVRDDARSHVEPSYLARLVASLEALPAATTQPPAALEYADLLDRVLEDRLVTEEEGAALSETATRWGLTQVQVLDIHQSYMESLVQAALVDGKVTDAERRDLELAARLFGMSPGAVSAMLSSPRDRPAELTKHLLPGLSVCFTGDSVCRLAGQEISRPLAEDLATKAGLVVRNSVTKDLDILVVADPHSLSGKAQKARRYGTRIMAEEVFWRAIGVEVE